MVVLIEEENTYSHFQQVVATDNTFHRSPYPIYIIFTPDRVFSRDQSNLGSSCLPKTPDLSVSLYGTLKSGVYHNNSPNLQ
ncbi:hypothetical protein TNCV_4937051 [Trichonephila clavipes]|nr:hypothetical protein TNCV_4937051 [Trichonephila clavipes]